MRHIFFKNPNFYFSSMAQKMKYNFLERNYVLENADYEIVQAQYTKLQNAVAQTLKTDVNKITVTDIKKIDERKTEVVIKFPCILQSVTNNFDNQLQILAQQNSEFSEISISEKLEGM